MHRSGTSIAARSIQLLGASLGEPGDLQPAGRDNPAGYWENRYIIELNDEVLAHLGGSWDQPPVLDPGWESDPSLDLHRSRAREILRSSFGPLPGPEGVTAWKDPRLSLLLPFWRTVTPVTTTVVVVRDPREVASSLLARNAIQAPQAALLWLRYSVAACTNDPSHLLVRHQDFFDDLRGTLVALAGHLSLPEPDLATEALVGDHLDPALRHHISSDGDSTDDNPIVAMALAVWNGGGVALETLGQSVTDGLGRGWLRPPIDTEALAQARAELVELQERNRRRKRAAQEHK